MKLREFIRSHLWLKNLLSNLELLAKTLLRFPIEVENDYFVDDYSSVRTDEGYFYEYVYYAIAHVKFGHIPIPLVWRIVLKYGKFVDVGERYACIDEEEEDLELYEDEELELELA